MSEINKNTHQKNTSNKSNLRNNWLVLFLVIQSKATQKKTFVLKLSILVLCYPSSWRTSLPDTQDTSRSRQGSLLMRFNDQYIENWVNPSHEDKWKAREQMGILWSKTWNPKVGPSSIRQSYRNKELIPTPSIDWIRTWFTSLLNPWFPLACYRINFRLHFSW